MNQHEDQLREAFHSHEYLAPDLAAVYEGIQARARGQQRRRRAAQTAGVAVLGAGLIAGGFAVPGLLPGGHPAVTVQDPAGAPAAQTTPPTPAELRRDYDAYFAAGYGYDDAIELAKVWQVRNDPGTVKAEAGRRLLAGEDLPIAPTGNDSPGSTGDQPTGEEAAVNAYFAAGYDYADAVKLSKLWKTATPYDAKAEAGQKLLDGHTLPIRP